MIEVGSVSGATDLGRVVVGGDQTTLTVPQVSVNTMGFARVRARKAALPASCTRTCSALMSFTETTAKGTATASLNGDTSITYSLS